MKVDDLLIGRFRAEFLTAWGEREARENARGASEDLRDVYKNVSAWTRVMLGDKSESLKDGVLDVTASRLGIGTTPHHEWYTLDLVLTKRLPLLRDRGDGDGEYWRQAAIVVVEHENADDVETEMWKLVHWRAKLKVLVFYDFSDDDSRRKRSYSADKSIGPVQGRDWLDSKRQLLSDMAIATDVELGDDPADFLLVVGAWVQTAPRHKAPGVAWRFSARSPTTRSFPPFEPSSDGGSS